ncbi:MAG: tyrosine-type recombinase/integrase [Bacteroidota bacterium]
MKIQPYLWKKSNKDKKFPIKIRITEKRKSQFINVGYSIKKEYWNENQKEVRNTYPNKDKVSKLITDKIEQIKKEKSINLDLNTYNKSSFLEYFQKHIDNLQTGKHISDMKKHMVVKKHIQDYLKKTYSKDDLLFKEITNQFIVELQSYFDGLKLCKNTQNGYFKKIKHLYYDSITSKVFQPLVNPFETFDNKSSKPKNNTLTKDEFKGIELFNPSHYNDKNIINTSTISTLFHSRNIFTFQFYSYGMRVSDVIMLKWDCINNKHIVYTMRKTNLKKSIKINNSINERLRFYLPINLIITYLKRGENIKDVELLCNIPLNDRQILLKEIQQKNPELYKIVEEKIKTYYKLRIYKENDIDYETLLNLYNFVGSHKVYKLQYIFPLITSEDLKKIENPDNQDKETTIYKVIQSKTTLYNKDLKKINKYFQDTDGQFIKTKITSHLPRHSYTSIVKDLGLDIYSISQSLGHSDIKTTQIYLKTLDKGKVDDENISYFDKFSEMDDKIVDDNKNVVIRRRDQLKPL